MRRDSDQDDGVSRPVPGGRRRASRLAAVQALYQLTLGGQIADGSDVEDTIIEFLTHRPGAEFPEDAYAEVDNDMFSDLVRGACRHHDSLVAILDGVLPARWKYARLDQILAKVLCSAAYEMRHRPDVPVAVIINEYVVITKAFYVGDERGFINGILQEVAGKLRGEEVLEYKNEHARFR